MNKGQQFANLDSHIKLTVMLNKWRVPLRVIHGLHVFRDNTRAAILYGDGDRYFATFGILSESGDLFDHRIYILENADQLQRGQWPRGYERAAADFEGFCEVCRGLPENRHVIIVDTEYGFI